MKYFLIATGFLALLVAVASADAVLNKEEIAANVTGSTRLSMSSEGQKTSVGTPVVAVPRASGPDVLGIVTDAGLSPTESASEQSLLAQVGNTTTPVQTRVLMSGNDRIGAISWVTDPNVKTVFSALKQALLSSFSTDVQGLRDEKEENSGFQTRTILTFLDPKLSSERFLFVQSGENLYEMHIAAGHEELFYDLVDGLTKR